MATKVGVLGSGPVGETLANGFLKYGYEVMRGTRDPAKLDDWKRTVGAKASTGTFHEAARFGEIIVLCVKGTAAEAVVRGCANDLAGKTVIDTSNPIADEAPVNGVLRYFTGPNESLMQRLMAIEPGARFVKAFSCVGSPLMVDPTLDGARPTMFMCGDDAGAKAKTQEILAKFGWEWEDLGGAEAARAIEPLAMLWCVPGFLRNDWRHALKMLR